MDESNEASASARSTASARRATRGGASTASMRRGVPPSPPDALEAGAHGETSLLDPRDARTQALLRRRAPGGAYEVSEAALIQGIRAWRQRGDHMAARQLSEVLVDRCVPEFQRRAWGLRHRPHLMEDAMAGMVEQLLREAQDPAEKFMTQNFVHYLRCLCADNFNRVLRQEGLSYRRDEQGRPAGRPQHVPQALVDRIDIAVEEREDASGQSLTIADPRDDLGERMAAVEAQRILSYLADPLDRRIVVLRTLEHMRWDDIAQLCGKTERTMRLRHEKAMVVLRRAIEAEAADTAAQGEE